MICSIGLVKKNSSTPPPLSHPDSFHWSKHLQIPFLLKLNYKKRLIFGCFRPEMTVFWGNMLINTAIFFYPNSGVRNCLQTLENETITYNFSQHFSDVSSTNITFNLMNFLLLWLKISKMLFKWHLSPFIFFLPKLLFFWVNFITFCWFTPYQNLLFLLMFENLRLTIWSFPPEGSLLKWDFFFFPPWIQGVYLVLYIDKVCWPIAFQKGHMRRYIFFFLRFGMSKLMPAPP